MECFYRLNAAVTRMLAAAVMYSSSLQERVKHCYWLFLVLNILNPVSATQLGTGQTVVIPKIIQHRSDSGGKLLKITEDLMLNLEKSSVAGEEFLLRTYQGPVMQHQYLDGEALEEGLYHDSRALASVIISEKNGLEVEGILGPNLRIKPLVGQERTSEGQIKHVLYEYDDSSVLRDGKEMAIDPRTQNVSERLYTEQGSYVPEKIYPELMIVVDSAFRSQFSSSKKLLKYVLVTVNAANLRYLTVSNPAVKLKVRALEILSVAHEPFIKVAGGRLIYGSESLTAFKMHVYDHKSKYGEYDIVYLITGRDMIQYLGYWDFSLAGLAYVGGACGPLKVGYGEDAVGTFKGVRILAHEIGHLLGCPHDGTSTLYRSSMDCPWTAGYIMSYTEADSKSMKFSRCCNREMTAFVRTQHGACLLEVITRRKISRRRFTKYFPGMIYTRDYQCKLAFPTLRETHFSPDYYGIENCRGHCSVPKEVYGHDTYLQTFMMDYSPCNGSNSGKVCINGDCKVRQSKYPVEPTLK
ncbi:venom metalloproteinase antarease-like TtrivMP_A [Haemaphysalis longicornis]